MSQRRNLVGVRVAMNKAIAISANENAVAGIIRHCQPSPGAAQPSVISLSMFQSTPAIDSTRVSRLRDITMALSVAAQKRVPLAGRAEASRAKLPPHIT